MPIRIERLPEESIISAVVSEPFDPERDMPAMFAEFIPLRLTMQGRVALIIDFSSTLNVPDAFSQMVLALAEASRGIRAGKEAGVGGPPITIFVGTGAMAALASQAIGQAQYGGAPAILCTSFEEAVAVARDQISG